MYHRTIAYHDSVIKASQISPIARVARTKPCFDPGVHQILPVVSLLNSQNNPKNLLSSSVEEGIHNFFLMVKHAQ